MANPKLGSLSGRVQLKTLRKPSSQGGPSPGFFLEKRNFLGGGILPALKGKREYVIEDEEGVEVVHVLQAAPLKGGKLVVHLAKPVSLSARRIEKLYRQKFVHLETRVLEIQEELARSQQLLHGLSLATGATERAEKARPLTKSPAEQAIAALHRELLAEGLLGTQTESTTLVKGEETLVGWTEDGTLVPSKELEVAWKRTRPALEQMVKRGELFRLKVRNRSWYPSFLLKLMASDVAAVCKAYGEASAIEHFLFWTRKQKTLGGKSAAELLSLKPAKAETKERLLKLAAEEANEQGR